MSHYQFTQGPDVCGYNYKLDYNVTVVDAVSGRSVAVILRPTGGWVTVGGVYNITVIARNELGDNVEWKGSFIGEL